MSIVLQFRDEIDETVGKELDQVTAAINASFGQVYTDLAPAEKDYCQIFSDTVQAIASGVETTVTFNRNTLDPFGMHKTAAGVNYFAIILNTGFYRIDARIAFTNGAGDRYILIQTLTRTLSTIQLPACVAIDTVIQSSAYWQLTKGEIVYVRAWQNSGGPLNIGNTTRYASNELVVTQLF